MFDGYVAAFYCRNFSRRWANSWLVLLVLELQGLVPCFCGLYVLPWYRLPVPIIFFLEAINQSALRFIAQIRLHLADPFLPAFCLFHSEWKHRLADLNRLEHHRHLLQSHHRLNLLSFWGWGAVEPCYVGLIRVDYTWRFVYLLFTAFIVSHFHCVFWSVVGQSVVFRSTFVWLLIFSEGIELKAENLFGMWWAGMSLLCHFAVSSLHLPRVCQRHAFLSSLFLPILLPPAQQHTTPCWLFHSM